LPGVLRKPGMVLSLLILAALLSAAVTSVAAAPQPSKSPLWEVDFSAKPTSGYAPLPVRFTDETRFLYDTRTEEPGDVNMCEWVVTWDFGDGKTAERRTREPQEITPFDTNHTYMQPGQYSVSLTYEYRCPDPAVAGFLPLDALFHGHAPNQMQRVTLTRHLYIKVLEPKKDDRPLEPARMSVSNFFIDPVQVLPNQEVVISANVCNGGEESGSKTVTLLVNGEAVESQSVGVSGGACKQVTFRVARAVPGTYQVAVDGMQGQFSVLAPRTVTNTVASQQNVGLGTAGIVAIVAVVVVLVIALVVVFKKD